MKVTILGSGTSAGVPFIGCKCAICQSKDLRNKRLRSSCLITLDDGCSILIDAAQDFRQQALNNNIKKIDAVLYTHEHADHILGTPDLRSFNIIQNQKINIYAETRTLKHLKNIFYFCFQPPAENWPRPVLIDNEITAYREFSILNHSIMPISLPHGSITTTGFIINKLMAYIVDFSDLTKENLDVLKKLHLKLIIFDCEAFTRKNASTHPQLSEIIQWANFIKPKQVYLTHMGHSIDYIEVTQYLIESGLEFIKLAYDGLIIDV